MEYIIIARNFEILNDARDNDKIVGMGFEVRPPLRDIAITSIIDIMRRNCIVYDIAVTRNDEVGTVFVAQEDPRYKDKGDDIEVIGNSLKNLIDPTNQHMVEINFIKDYENE